MRPGKGSSARKELDQLAESIKRRFMAEKRVLSYDEYLDELIAHPWRHSRDAARYLKDCFDHYGSYEVQRPWGTLNLYIDLQNVVNHENAEGVTYNKDYTRTSYTTGLPIFPSIGVEYIP